MNLSDIIDIGKDLGTILINAGVLWFILKWNFNRGNVDHDLLIRLDEKYKAFEKDLTGGFNSIRKRINKIEGEHYESTDD